MFNSVWQNKGLIKTLIIRDIHSRYRGSVIGILWSLLNPILLLLVYTFVFGIVFNTKWGGTNSTNSEFALVLFSGLIVFNTFSECFNRAPNLIVLNSNYVKKVIFPLEILPVVSLGSAIFNALVCTGVWFLAYVILVGIPHLTATLLPIVFIPLIMLTLGTSWILSSLGVYFRDVSQFIGIGTTALMFLSPIFYPISSIPEKYQKIIMLNPLSIIIEETRRVLFFGELPNFYLILSLTALAFLFAWFSFVFFQKSRKGFSDVL